jgi:hypothetical protein
VTGLVVVALVWTAVSPAAGLLIGRAAAREEAAARAEAGAFEELLAGLPDDLSSGGRTALRQRR